METFRFPNPQSLHPQELPRHCLQPRCQEVLFPAAPVIYDTNESCLLLACPQGSLETDGYYLLPRNISELILEKAVVNMRQCKA